MLPLKIAFRSVILLMFALLQGQLTARAENRDEADNIEIKFVIKEAEVERAIEAHGPDKDEAEKRMVYFFDTKDLSLFDQAGTSVILRARITAGDRERETTVKLSSKEPLQIEDQWMQAKRNSERLDRKGEKDRVVTKPAGDRASSTRMVFL